MAAPKLRFKEFGGDWDPPNFINICTYMKSKPLILKELRVFLYLK